MKQRTLWVAAAFMGLLHVSAHAQNRNLPSASAATKNEARPDASRPMVSLSAVLQMRESQMTALNRVYEDVSSRRLQQESRLAQSHAQLRQAQSPTAFDERKAARLMREINETEQKIAADFLSARAKALKVLEPIQRAQLESVAGDTRFTFRPDRFYQLLLMPLEQLGRVGLDTSPRGENARRLGASRGSARRNEPVGSGSYGVYGGYSYDRPQLGVYGNYGRGGVGVHAGIGLGGPSIGIGIGRVFGGGFRR